MRHLPIIAILLAAAGLVAADPAPLPTAVFRSLRAGKPQVVVTYGTSLTEYGPWVAMLKPWFDQRYPGLVTVVNSGGSGQHSGWGLANVKARVVDKHPDLVFLEFGINDAHVRFKLTPAAARENLDGMVKAIRAGNAQTSIVLQTMNATLDTAGKTAATDRPRLEEFYANYSACAAADRLPLIDNFPAWRRLAKDDAKTFIAYAPDGLHPNKAGILAITWPNIEKLLLAAEKAAGR